VSVIVRLSAAGGLDPVGYSHVTDSSCFSDGDECHPDVVSLHGETEPSRAGFPDLSVRALQLRSEFRGAGCVSDLFWLAAAPGRIGWAHGQVPFDSRGVESALAQPAGTWKDPTRHSLGSVLDNLVFVSTTRDLPVARITVNDDRCSSCSKSIVPICRLHAPSPSTGLHSASFTRKNRERASSAPACGAPQYLTASGPRGRRDLRARGDEVAVLPSRG
jgi:hypothetical protein